MKLAILLFLVVILAACASQQTPLAGAPHLAGASQFLGGDANMDGKVDLLDVGIVLANFNTAGKTWSQGDFNGDGRVNNLDVGILLTNYNKSALDVPVLHSNPTAPVKIYLDFDGAPPSTFWGINVPTTPAYDTDGSPATFNDAERANITQIWQRVADKFAPFNVDVTTQNPGTFPDGVAVHVIIGGDGAWLGSGGASSISQYNSFYYDFEDNVAYLFTARLNLPYSISETIAHEVGNMFGLYTQQVFDAQGMQTSPYNGGNVQLAPIMGRSIGSHRGMWWVGTVNQATNIQDEVPLLASKFGYRADDFGNTTSTAFGLSSGVTVSGLIGQLSDVDYFKFTTAGGSVTINVNAPEYDASIYAQLGVMLYPTFKLMNSSGQQISLVDTGPKNTLTSTLAAGTYYVVVSGHGMVPCVDGSGNSLGKGEDVGRYTITGIYP